jgi:hypothetical protein
VFEQGGRQTKAQKKKRLKAHSCQRFDAWGKKVFEK